MGEVWIGGLRGEGGGLTVGAGGTPLGDPSQLSGALALNLGDCLPELGEPNTIGRFITLFGRSGPRFGRLPTGIGRAEPNRAIHHTFWALRPSIWAIAYRNWAGRAQSGDPSHFLGAPALDLGDCLPELGGPNTIGRLTDLVPSPDI